MNKEYDFNKCEQKWQNYWEKEKIFNFDFNSDKEIYSIDTPPPTLSGKMHIGHAFSYTQQDVMARYKRMMNKNVLYPFGTDDNGLATEKLVEKENKIKIFEIKRKDFIELCQKTIEKLRPNFIKDWKDIGMSCDFDLKYSTISPEVQKISQSYFIDLYHMKRAYRKEGPTVWCPQCQTAIAQAEMEDKEKDSVFYDINFETENGKITIATTRPELLPSCVAIFVHPDDKRYVNFIDKYAFVPIFNQKVKIIKDNSVNPEKGTGVVMCCTFGDTNDIEWFLTYNLPLKISISKDGKFNENAGKYKELPIKKGKEMIVKDLKDNGMIIGEKQIVHTLNVHERCGTPIEIISTNQWFIKYLDLKNDFLKLGDQLSWTPNHFKNRYNNWVNGLKWDWCISRQRYFGIPFPVWYCTECKKEIVAKKSELPVDPFSNKPSEKCCNNQNLIPDKNVLDTWATSALTPQIIQSLIFNEEIKKNIFPMSLRPQAHDIINFWLFYSIARSKLHFNLLPWKKTTISGFVLDEKGEKMSKSKGNVINPQDITSKYSADALRYWATSVGFGEDIRWSEKEINTAKRTLNKIWNASKFSINHIENYNLKEKDFENLENEDKWIFTKFQKMIEKYFDYFEKYQYEKARKELDLFFWDNYCSNYIEIIKSRLYNSKRFPNSARYTIYCILLGILKLYSPFIPHITEEIYFQYFKNHEKNKSIHLSLMPKKDDSFCFSEINKEMEEIIQIFTEVRKYKSENKISLNSKITELIIDSKNKNFNKYFELFKDVLIINEINYGKGDRIINDNLSIKLK